MLAGKCSLSSLMCSNMGDLNEATVVIQEVVNSEACISYCSSTDDTLAESIRVTVIATGFENPKAEV